MEKKYLLEYLEKEKEIAELLTRDVVRSLDNDRPISIADFYPGADKYKDGDYFNYVLSDKISSQLPFSGGLITSIWPYTDEKSFIKKYGMTVEDIYNLSREGLIVPIINCQIVRYVNLDYLDGLWDFRPKTYVRQDAFFNIISNGNYSLYYREAARKFRGRLKTEAAKHGWMGKYFSGREAYETKVCHDFARLKSIYPARINSILSKDTVESARQVLLEDKILVDPFTEALNCHHRIDSEDHRAQGKYQSQEYFPNDIGKILTGRYKMNFPDDIDIDILKKIMHGKIHQSGRRALNALDKAIIDETGDERKARATAVIEVWRETCDELDSLKTAKSISTKAALGVMIGVSGLMAYNITHDPMDGIYSIPMAASAGKYIYEQAAGKIVRIKEKMHVAAIWDLEERMRKVKK